MPLPLGLCVVSNYLAVLLKPVMSFFEYYAGNIASQSSILSFPCEACKLSTNAIKDMQECWLLLYL